MEKKFMVRIFVNVCVAFLMVTLFSVTICGTAKAAEEKPKVFHWKWAEYVPSTGLHALAYEYWVQELERRSAGRLKVKIYWGGALSGAKEMLESGKSGLADVVSVCPAYFPGKTPLLALGFVPFANLLRTDQFGFAWNYLSEHPLLKKEFDTFNLRYAWIETYPMFNVMSRKALRTIDDFEGLKIRSVGYQAELFKLLGATPVAVTYADIFTSLDRGLIDASPFCGYTMAYDIQAPDALRGKGYQVDGLDISGVSTTVLINKDSYNALPSDLKRIIDCLTWEMPSVLHEALCGKTINDMYMTYFKSKGIQQIVFPKEEREKMSKLASQIHANWKEEYKAAGSYEFFDAYMKANKRVMEEYPQGIYKEGPLRPEFKEKLFEKILSPELKEILSKQLEAEE